MRCRCRCDLINATIFPPIPTTVYPIDAGIAPGTRATIYQLRLMRHQILRYLTSNQLPPPFPHTLVLMHFECFPPFHPPLLAALRRGRAAGTVVEAGVPQPAGRRPGAPRVGLEPARGGRACSRGCTRLASASCNPGLATGSWPASASLHRARSQQEPAAPSPWQQEACRRRSPSP